MIKVIALIVLVALLIRVGERSGADELERIQQELDIALEDMLAGNITYAEYDLIVEELSFEKNEYLTD